MWIEIVHFESNNTRSTLLEDIRGERACFRRRERLLTHRDVEEQQIDRVIEIAMKSRNDQCSGGRRNCGGKSDTIRRHRHICCLCTASCVSVLFLVGFDYHGLMQAEFLFKQRIDVALPRCMKLCNPGLVKFSKRRGGDVFLSFLANDEKFMYYAPHSGFSNQVMELKNALLVAKILNRTLIIPPVLDHHAAWLGSCPKRRVLRPHRLRALVWMRIFDLISDSRYTSIADLVDISSITPSKVKTIDLRVFMALWCGVDVKASCGGTLCKAFAWDIFVWGEYETCVQMLNPVPPAQSNCCVYGVEDDCTSTIWTNRPKLLNNATVELRKDGFRRRFSKVTTADQTEPRKLLNVRRRAQLGERISIEHWKAEKVKKTKIEVVDVRSSLGPNSAAGISSVIAFGSMFSTIYKDVQSNIDITAPSGDEDLDDLIRSLKLLSFSSEIIAAGKAYIHEEIAQPTFFCAQLRLSDGQFKNHWNATFRNMKARLTSSRAAWPKITPTPIFVMTDLPSENWTKTELNDLLLDSRNSYQVHKLHTRNDLIQIASRRILSAEAGFVVGSISASVEGLRKHQEQSSVPAEFKIPHVELAIEEVICSCARLGFSGTHGSTIADSIRDLRAIGICSTGLQSVGFET